MHRFSDNATYHKKDMQNELEGCPLCGYRATTGTDTIDEETRIIFACLDCDLYLYGNDFDELKRRWNERVPIDPLEHDREDIVEALLELANGLQVDAARIAEKRPKRWPLLMRIESEFQARVFCDSLEIYKSEMDGRAADFDLDMESRQAAHATSLVIETLLKRSRP